MSLPNYDAWKLASPPEPDVAGKCEECGCELFEGDDVYYEPDSRAIYCSEDCFKAFVKRYFDDFFDVLKEAMNLQKIQMTRDEYYDEY
mgnify:FL=1